MCRSRNRNVSRSPPLVSTAYASDAVVGGHLEPAEREVLVASAAVFSSSRICSPPSASAPRGTPAMHRVLLPCDRARVVLPRTVRDRRRHVGLLHACLDLLEDLLLQRGRRREHGFRVGVLRFEMCEHVGVVSLPQPVPVVDALVAVLGEHVGRRGAFGGVGVGTAASLETPETGKLDRYDASHHVADVDADSVQPERDRRGRVRRRRAGPGHRAGGRNRAGPDVRVVEPRGAGTHARDRPHLVLEPQPPGVLVQGGDLGRSPVPARGLLRLRHGRPPVRRRAGGTRGVSHGRAVCFFRAFGSGATPGPV